MYVCQECTWIQLVHESKQSSPESNQAIALGKQSPYPIPHGHKQGAVDEIKIVLILFASLRRNAEKTKPLSVQKACECHPLPGVGGCRDTPRVGVLHPEPPPVGSPGWAARSPPPLGEHSIPQTALLEANRSSFPLNAGNLREKWILWSCFTASLGFPRVWRHRLGAAWTRWDSRSPQSRKSHLKLFCSYLSLLNLLWG